MINLIVSHEMWSLKLVITAVGEMGAIQGWEGAVNLERELECWNSMWHLLSGLCKVWQDIVENTVQVQDRCRVETDGAVAVKTNTAKCIIKSEIRKRWGNNEMALSPQRQCSRFCFLWLFKEWSCINLGNKNKEQMHKSSEIQRSYLRIGRHLHT